MGTEAAEIVAVVNQLGRPLLVGLSSGAALELPTLLVEGENSPTHVRERLADAVRDVAKRVWVER